jgi:1-aminocyclopropane-1-carboxylate deaminase/D-cysteine desulfhydrase-like pyridoxal-dependent ACC family enzyme
LISDLALVRRFPALARIPRVSLGAFPSPVERLDDGDRVIWIKRDDLDAPTLAGNKVRALEFLLAGVREGTRVLTMGGIGSTHILATATHAARLGGRTTAYRWPHESNAIAAEVAREIDVRCDEAMLCSSIVTAVGRALWRRATSDTHWVPFGGTSPVGMLGHVNAALELAEQVARGDAPEPAEVWVPLGSGGTAAGLALGFAIAGFATTVVAVRCGPRLGVDESRLQWLAWRVGQLIAREHGRPGRSNGLGAAPRLRIHHGAYAGSYGRPLAAAEPVVTSVNRILGIRLDATYSAKACYAAFTRAEETTAPVLLWQTFDGRWMDTGAAGTTR